MSDRAVVTATLVAAASATVCACLGGPWPAIALAVGFLVAVSVARPKANRPRSTTKAAGLETPDEQLGIDAWQVIDATSAAVLVVDDRGLISRANPAARRILGSDAVVGVPVAKFLPTVDATAPVRTTPPGRAGTEAGSDAPVAVPGWKSAAPAAELAMESNAPREHLAMSGDGTMREVAVHVDLVCPTGPASRLLVLMDVTSLHDAERQLLVQNNLLQSASTALFDAKASAEEASRRKTQFLAYASHEIRTPLTAILGFAEQLDDRSVPEGEREEAVRIVRRNAEHLLTVLSDILDLAKIEADLLEVRDAPCDLRGTLAQVRGLLSLTARERGVELRIEEKTPLPATVQTDETRLRQILINLVGNAVRATTLAGTPGTAPCVRVGITADAASELVSIEIADEGPPLPASVLERMFEPFDHGAAAADRRLGLALGLAISRRLARLLGGDLVARTGPGTGTTMLLTFKAGPLEPVALWTQRVHGTGTGGTETDTPLHARILLAEDGRDNQRLITSILRRAGAEVAVANDGAQAVSAVVRAAQGGQPFDAIIMDMQMPVMDGYEATARLRATGHTQPILALTANALADAREHCLDVGCDDYACKPIDRRRLVAVLRDLLRRPGRRPPGAAAHAVDLAQESA